MRLSRIPLLVAASVTVAGFAVWGPIGLASAATPVTQIKKIAPASGPELSSIPVKVRGSNFNTASGETMVFFGGEPALSVSCESSKVCTAMTPELIAGPVEVTVTSNGMTSTTPAIFTYETYSPPLVKIVPTKFAPVFSRIKLVDRYAGIFDPGNVYLQIENTLFDAATVDGPTGLVKLLSGETEGYNLPVDESTPYVFTIGYAFANRETLTVSTETPR
jgi:hypothetical protein